MKDKKNIKYNELVADETIEDYSLRYAPKSFRKWSEFLIANTAIGSISFLALEAIGASIAITYGFSTAFWAILVASIIIFITAIPISYHAAKYNIDIDLITRSAGFGYVGSTFTSLIYASFSFIFFALEAAIMAQAIELYFGIPLGIGYLICSLVIIPMVFYGFTFINKLQLYTQPIWLIMMIAPFIAILVKEPNALNILTSVSGDISKSNDFDFYYFGFAIGISLSLIAQIGEQVDYLRFMPPLTKENKVKWYASMLIAGPGWIIIGFLKQIGGIFLMAIAVFAGSSLYEAKTPIEMYNIGYTYIVANPSLALTFATFFVVVSQIKINVTNAYAGSLAWSNFFSRITHSHPGRVVWMIFNIAIALLLMELGLFDVLENILGLYSNVAIAWISAIFADLTINKPLGLSPKIIEFKRAYLYNINPVGVGSMGIASIISIFAFMGVFGDWAQSYSSILAMFIAIFLSPLIAYLTKGKYYIARANIIKENEQEHYICTSCSHQYEKEDVVFCPLVNSHICSLCCTLDSLCHDSCKIKQELTIRDKIAHKIETLLNNKFHKDYIYKILDFLSINFIIFFILGIIGWMTFSMQVTKLAPEDKDVLKSIIANIMVVVGIFTTILTWWIILMQDSKNRAEKELENQNETLNKQKDEFEAIYNGSKDAIAILDMQSNFLAINPAYLEITRFTEEELLKTSCLSLTVEKDIESSKIAMQEVLDIGHIKNFEKSCIIKDNKVIIINMSMSLLKSPKRVLISVRDITKQKENEKILQDAIQKAKEAVKTKSEFLANMSHEIRTPMNGILGMSHLVLQTELSEKQKNYIYKIDNSAKNLLEIINDILDFSKVEAGKLSIEKTNFNLFEVINNVIGLIELKAHEKNLEIIIDYDTTMGHTFYGDSLRISQVLTNLFTNAVKFTEKGEIYLYVKKVSNTKVLFKVIDTGIGLTKEQQEKLFQSFTQADGSTTRKYGGTGLGLAISKQLVELMNGKIWIESEVEMGSSFIFEIELIEKINEIKFQKFSNKSVLIVDDNESWHTILENLLDIFDVEIAHAYSGQEAYQKICNDKNRYNLVFMDWNMPDLNGIETTKNINKFCAEQEKKEPLSIIMTSAYRKEQIMTQANSVGIDIFLQKPFDIYFIYKILCKVFLKEDIDLEHTIFRENETITTDISVLEGSKILLVEDNKTNQEIVIGLLENSGLEIDIVDNGQKAVESVKNNNDYELILMDIQMPVMNGYEATKIIKEINPNIPIIALTANAMKEDIQRTKKAGMNEHLNKPIEIDKLYQVLLKYISLKHKSTKKILSNEVEIELPNFKYINTKKGLKLLSSKKLYLKILRDFYNDYKELSLETLDTENLKRVFHTIKGLSANIGADALNIIAQKLETIQDKSLFSDFYKELNFVIKDLELLPEEKKPKNNKEKIDKELKDKLFEELKQASKSRKAKQCNSIIDELAKYSLNDQDDELFQDIKKFIKKYKFKDVVKVLDDAKPID